MGKTFSKDQQIQRGNTSKVQRTAIRPRPTLATPGGVLQLQRNAGNLRVNQLIQAKLTVGAAHDPLEHEADRVADQVVRGATDVASKKSAGAQQVHRNTVDEDELMTKRNPSTGSEQGMLNAFDAGADFEQQLSQTGGGKPLDRKTRSEMEAGIGSDFSQVRIYTNAQASQLNRSISARAFTRGSDVFFAYGQYNPSSTAGKHLLAHELTHVVQQGGASQAGGVQRKTTPHIQRDFWDRFKKKKKKEDAAPQTAAWLRHGYRDSSNRDTRIGALSTAGYRVAEHRRMSNDFKWMEQAMANNVDMTEDTEANFYMNEGRKKANSHASDMDQFDFMQDQMSKAWWALNSDQNPLWQKANESYGAPRQNSGDQFLSKANQQRWTAEQGMRMAGKQKVDPHDAFKTYKGGNIFTAEANGDPKWDRHAGKRMAYIDNDDNYHLPRYEEVPESYGPGIESPAQMIDMGDEIDTDSDAEESNISVDDVLDAAGETVEEGETQSDTTSQGQTERGATSNTPPRTRQYQNFQPRDYTSPFTRKKKSVTAKQVGQTLNNNLNPVRVVKNLKAGLGALQKTTQGLNKWEKAIREGDQLLSGHYAKSYSSIWLAKVTAAKVTKVALLAPVQGPYVLANTYRAKKLYKQHRAKWGGQKIDD